MITAAGGSTGSGGVAARLADRWQGHHDRVAFETDRRRHHYGDLVDDAGRVAAALRRAGATVGDRVVVAAPKSPTVVGLYLGCSWGGYVHVPLNPAFTDAELQWFLDDAEPAVVVVDPGRVEAVAAGIGATVLTLDADGNGSLRDAADRAAADPPAPVTGDDLAALLYTSGTTGRPKGAMLSHDALWHNAVALHDTWRFEPDDVLVHILPLFHVHGLFVALHCALLSTARVRFLRRFSVDGVLAALDGASVLMGVPTHYDRLLADPRFDRTATASMRLFTSGSAPMTPATFATFRERTGHIICERYGMSETGILTSNPYDGPRLSGTVGMPLPGVELRVVDDDGAPAPLGDAGVVEVRGPNVGDGYWRRPDATTASRRPDGWFVTGDIGRLDADGRLTLEGRQGDMIISGGENIYPREIEAVLDDVDGIVESAVIGVAHGDLGEQVVAVVVAEPSHDQGEVRRRIDDALAIALARFKHPRAVRFVDELTRNTMGKVQKQRLRQEWTAESPPRDAEPG